MKRLLIMGPPGAGKGTQGAALADAFAIPSISTGGIFREEVRLGTELGQRIRRNLAAGKFVADDLTNIVVKRRLSQPDASAGFILDGYPRTRAQATELDRELLRINVSLDAVIHLDANVGELTERLSQRASEEGRSDDVPDAIRRRIVTYHEVTAPLLAIYRRRDLLLTVDALQTREEITSAIRHHLGLAPP